MMRSNYLDYSNSRYQQNQVCVKTKLCDSIGTNRQCRHGNTCRYAHSTDELTCIPCHHGERCRNVKLIQNEYIGICKYIHPQETKTNFIKRTIIPNETQKPWYTEFTQGAVNVDYWIKHGYMDNYTALRARDSFIEAMDSYDISKHSEIPNGEILQSEPTKEDCINAAVIDLKTWMSDYDRNKFGVEYTNTHLPVKNRGLCLNIYTPNQCIERHMCGIQGFLAESFVVAHLNENNFICPECKKASQLGWIGNSQLNVSTSFKDVVCMGCKQNGVNTVFEIKTRNESSVNSKVLGGSFGAINYLLKKVNMYMIIVSRDTGKLFIGKIHTARPMASFTDTMFCYKLYYNDSRVSDLKSTPKAEVYCDFKPYHIIMKPLCTILTPEFCEDVSLEAIRRYESCKL